MLVQTQASTIETQASSLIGNLLGNKSSSNNPTTVTKKLDLSQPIPVNGKLAATAPTPFTNNLTKLGVDRIKNYRLFYPQSWKPTLNPYANVATEVIGDWLKELKIIKDFDTLRLFQEERPDLYGGYSFPLIGFERFTTITKSLVLWIMFDDLAIENENSRKYWTDNNLSLDDYLIALHNGYLSPNADPFLRAWWEIGQSFAEKMSKQWQNSFAKEFVDWVRQSIKEYELYTEMTRSGRFPDINTYFNIRSASVAMIPTCALIEYAEEFELPDEVKNHLVIKTMHELATKIVFLSNDIFSLEKDMINQWPNSVTVIQNEYKLSLDDALNTTVDLHNKCVFSFIDLESNIPSFGNKIDPFLHGYIEKLKFMCRGFTEFELVAERYRWKHHLAPGKVPFKVSVASFANG